MDVYEKLRGLNLRLPDAPKAGGVYSTAVVFGDRMCCTSGHNCKVNGVLPHVGKVGREVSLEEGREDARQCVLNILATLHAALGDLNRIERIVKILGFVASSDIHAAIGCGDQAGRYRELKEAAKRMPGSNYVTEEDFEQWNKV